MGKGVTSEKVALVENAAVNQDCRIVFEQTIQSDSLTVIGIDADPGFYVPGNKNNFPELIGQIEDLVPEMRYIGGHPGPSFNRIILNHQLGQPK